MTSDNGPTLFRYSSYSVAAEGDLVAGFIEKGMLPAEINVEVYLFYHSIGSMLW